MSRSIHRRTFLTTATALGVAASVPAARASGAVRVRTAFALPDDRAYPEGIGLDPRTGEVYVGSFTTGAVYRAAPGARTAEVFLPAGADGRTTANGLKVDPAGRLWVIDSSAGVDVYDTRTRELLARFEVPGDEARFVNDLAITPDGTVYLTDSTRALIYRAPRSGATLTPFCEVPHTRVANGIVATDRCLLVVGTTTGDLVRIDLATGTASQVTLRGGDLKQGDGLELVRGTLWAAHNTTNTISRWRLADDARSARLERTFTDTALQIPTTLVRNRGRLLVVRSQFDKGGPLGPGVPQTPFSVARVEGI
ncbi:SMP-30/gluconolactonase/LRE family protein [Streptomyces sp. 4N124]|uniref:SMP-30/gluconolactonase/LRE family protein n=1 Tax=Streptomyces sp. 4N124 TaxID=3457420 RepID=UPI003FD4D854